MAQQIAQIGLIVVVLSLPIAMWVFGVAMRRGRLPQLRSLSAFDALRGQLGRGIESGRPFHISIGTGGLVGDEALTTLAGASIIDSFSQEAADAGVSPAVTVADGSALILAQDTLRRPYTRRGDIAGYDPLSVQLLGMQPGQYALATNEFLAHARPVSNAMIGSFGPEVALIADAGTKQGLTQVAGSADVRALAALQLSADHLLMGEEIFAAGAYLDRRPEQVARLSAQDVARYILVAVILIAALLRTALG
ncbi:MAG TPA: DUF6754 domain-containing protein [Anaerolineae bacterium]|nr:DUF6754 domain-containing protein [Anaerolineae bacterium]